MYLETGAHGYPRIGMLYWLGRQGEQALKRLQTRGRGEMSTLGDVDTVRTRAAALFKTSVGDIFSYQRLRSLYQTAVEVVSLPRVGINLMLGQTASNAPFYRSATIELCPEAATRRRLPFPIFGGMELGFAVCGLNHESGPYSGRLDSAARRNLKKALRLGYRFRRIDYNSHLVDVTTIHRSTSVRAGARDAGTPLGYRGSSTPQSAFTERNP